MKCEKCGKEIDTMCQYDMEIYHDFVCHKDAQIEALESRVAKLLAFTKSCVDLCRSFTDYPESILSKNARRTLKEVFGGKN